MMVTFVSECEKKALNKTRRVLDAFANRIGTRTWQTVITNEGLQAVKKLLRKTASKNSAVSCHWIRSRSRSELVWIVGNRARFNLQGVVPVNYTDQEISHYVDKNQWQTIGVIQYATSISALFHDFGKANQLFQDKINPKKKTNSFEPYRHEWVSLRLFQAFVGVKNDMQWLDALSQIDRKEFQECFRDGLDGSVGDNHPLAHLPAFAKLVAWLILTHHKLPLYPGWEENKNCPPSFESIDNWLFNEESFRFEAEWNSHKCEDDDQKKFLKNNWEFEKCLPVESIQWRSKACMVASEARSKLQAWLKQEPNWLDEQLFTSHLARLCLMLADHHYSAQDKVTDEWRNKNYKIFANTLKINGNSEYKQKLDEHLIGVAYHANNIVRALPKLNSSLRQLEPNSFLTGKVAKNFEDDFGWQDKAKKIAKNLSKSSIEQGFFGINMASTGKGKTLANAKIMVALGSETGRIRFSVALGLRTLTLQTGKEFRKNLDLTDEDLAIAVGSIAVKQLFENANDIKEKPSLQETAENEAENETGSESQGEYVDPDLFINYEGDIYEHSLRDWTKKNDRLEKLIQAPVLVGTIDHLMPATEGTKGGKQIGPMLRLLTSDLVLDEPDDFGLNDLPALCRLVHWSGMLGSRVLLSTATMPPALASALFRAYRAGWGEYAKVNVGNWNGEINCAWFDEFDSTDELHKNDESFKKSHSKFVKSRIKSLKALESKVKPKRLGKIISIINESENRIVNLAKTIQGSLMELHQYHHQTQGNKNISVGLVRMANIDPLVAVAKQLLKTDVQAEDTSIHYCVYHSRYPLAIRSHIESKLDEILSRKKSEAIWQQEDIVKAIKQSKQTNHIFVVIASPVAEVGRDHDYDWAIIEPSSMRSIIQIAGRVLRHRNHIPEEANIVLLDMNYKAQIGKQICFDKPGFESNKLTMNTHDLWTVLDKEHYQRINSIPRIELPKKYQQDKKSGKYINLIELEHKALAEQLFTGVTPAKVWWENQPYWCGEVQRQQRFRNSQKDEAYYLWLTDKYVDPSWRWKNEDVYPAKFGENGVRINEIEVTEFGKGSHFWFDLNAQAVYQKIIDDFQKEGTKLDLEEVSNRFGEVRLIEFDNNQQEYNYAPNLGLYKDLGSENE